MSKTKMPLSAELQTGKAAEHLVCCDLILQGVNAFLADQGLPYDLIADDGDRLLRIQVKATRKLIHLKKQGMSYRFGLRRGRKSSGTFNFSNVDFFAFVALDIKSIAYLPSAELLAGTGAIIQTIDFKSRAVSYARRIYSNGKARRLFGRFIQDYARFTGILRAP
jgi:hypothetical protein